MLKAINLTQNFTARSVFKSIFIFQIISFLCIVFVMPNFSVSSSFNDNLNKIFVEEDKVEHKQIKDYSDKKYPVPTKIPGKLPLNINLPNNKTEGLIYKEISFPNLGLGLLASGGITTGDATKFKSILENYKEGELKFIALHSPGGFIEEALEIGKHIRGNNLNTVITNSATCLSACPYIFAGGVNRIKGLNSYIGVHQTYYYEDTVIPFYFAVKDVQKSHAELFRYLKEMDINHDIMEFILDTPPEDIYIIENNQLTEFNLVTDLIIDV